MEGRDAMRVRCIALYIDFLLYNPLYRLYIEIFLYSAIKYDFAGSSVGLPGRGGRQVWVGLG